MTMTSSEKTILRRALELEDALVEFTGPAARPMLNRLSDMRGEAVADAEDRILRVCGGLLLEHGVESVFDQIYARAIESDVQPGQARRFLFQGLEP